MRIVSKQLWICALVGLVPTFFHSLAPALCQAQPQVTPASKSTVIPSPSLTPKGPDTHQVALMNLLECMELYHPAKELKGAAVLSGSTTMMALGKAWADRFRYFHKDVTLTRGPDGTDAGIKACP